jgi:hypothetical protein
MASKANFGVAIASVLSLLALCGLAWGADSNVLISHWEFDEGAGTTAYDSVGGNHGTLINGPLWTSGQIGGALSFDGVNDYVDVGDRPSLDFGAGDSFSIAAWVKTGADGRVVDKRRCGGPGGVYYEGYGIRVLRGKLFFGVEDIGGNGSYLSGDTMVTDDEWHHVAAVRDVTTDRLYLYLDGSSDATPVVDTTISTLATDKGFDIGHAINTTTGHGYFNGKIDDVRIYDRALSAEEVWQLYQAGGGGLIAQWMFDEGEGDIAYDSAGDNDGIIYGAAWTSGQIGGALDFDGEDDYVRTLNNVFTNAQLASGATLSAWFKTDSAAYGLIADVEGYLNLGINLRDTINPNRLFGTADGGAHIYFSSSDVTDNVWYHAAIVWDGTNTASLYLDGVNVSSRFSGPPTPDSKGRPLAIGVHSTMAAYFGGIIDDVRVYNRALSAEEIRKLYENGSSGRSLPVRPRAGPDNIERAIRGKVEAWKKIDDMLKKEREVYEALEQMLRTGDYRSSSYSDIVTARYEIYSAIEQGERSKEALEKSIENLEAALAALGFELVPKASAWLGQAKLLIR